MKKVTKRDIIKSANGITLIALVVTIVVLLILAGITINLLFSDNGIITKAREAAEETAKAEEKETAGMQNMVNQMDDILDSVTENTLVAMYNAGLVCENLDTCTDESHLHIGDYVNYANPASGSYTVTAAKSGMNYDQTFTLSSTVNNVNWRVLGLDEETGGLKLIADSPIKIDEIEGEDNQHLKFRDGNSYIYGITELNNICEMYKNDLVENARSITLDDIDQVIGIKGKSSEEKEAVNILTSMFSSLPLGTEYNFTDHYTPESYFGLEPYTEAGTKTTVSGISTAYGYAIVKTENEKIEMEANGITPVLLTNIRAYNMLFEGTEFRSGKTYFLASRSVLLNSNKVYFRLGYVVNEESLALCMRTVVEFGFNSLSGASYAFNNVATVRPVVCLKSTVTSNDIQKIEDQPDSWVIE